MKKLCLLTVLASALFLFPHTATARSAYVTDTFRISLRRGPSVENKILKFLPSGQPVTIKETTDGWDRVRIQEGEDEMVEGWVLSRYLMDRPPWETQAQSLLQENARLKKELEDLQGRLGRSERQIHDRLKAMTDDHGNAIEAVQVLTAENRSLKSYQRMKWFGMGVGVILTGILIGLIAGRQKRSPLSSYL